MGQSVCPPSTKEAIHTLDVSTRVARIDRAEPQKRRASRGSSWGPVRLAKPELRPYARRRTLRAPKRLNLVSERRAVNVSEGSCVDDARIAMCGRRPHCKKNLTFAWRSGASHVSGLFARHHDRWP